MVNYGTAKAVSVDGYRTQKAKGVHALSVNGFNTPAYSVYGVQDFQPQIEDSGQIQMFASPDTFNKLLNRFVRPCPMVPRHGFVDSRPIMTEDEAQRIVEETIAAEPDAELLVMPFIDSEYSGIWTTGKLIIGTGTDGATAGKSSKVIPVIGHPSKCYYNPEKWEQALQMATITDAPYVELLWKEDKYSNVLQNYFVQLRNGPKLPDAIDYIPAEMPVTNVVLAEGDLLKWETKVKTFAKGTAIYHPSGSLASHYAVHAVLSGIPVLVSRQPMVGEILVPNTDVSEPDIQKIRSGFVHGATCDIDMISAAKCMLLGCHLTSVWLGKMDELLGFALGCAYRLIITAGLGEFRHQPGRRRKPSRNAVYKGVWKKMLKPATRTRYMKSLESFENDPWCGSYGGKKWLEFSQFAGQIYNAILDSDIKLALENLNHATHAAHNSGWAFDKFLNKNELDTCAANPTMILLQVAPKVYDALVLIESDNQADWFKYKKHIEIEAAENPAVVEASSDENEEIDEECEYEGCGECDECGCSICNPDGCPNYPHCNSCGFDCNDSDCETCHPYAGEVIEAQVKLMPIFGGASVWHVQFKYEVETGKGYQTKDVKISSEELERVSALWNFVAKDQMSYAGKTQGYAALKKVFGYWAIGTFVNSDTPKSQYWLFNLGIGS